MELVEVEVRCDEIESRMKAVDSGYGPLVSIGTPSRAEWVFQDNLRRDLRWLLEQVRKVPTGRSANNEV